MPASNRVPLSAYPARRIALLKPSALGDIIHSLPVLTALRRLEVTTEEALYVGDMTIDVQTGQAAGVTVWTVATGSSLMRSLDSRPAARPLTS